MTSEYVCIEEDRLTKLEARADFKEQRIDDLERKIEKMDKKLDKITENQHQMMLKSVQDDNNLNQRVTALESSQTTTRWLIGIGFTVVGTAIGILGFLMTLVGG